MPVHLATVAKDHGICEVCGERCEPWREGVWSNGARLIHERCQDWNERPFPYDWELERLRKLAKALRRTVRTVDATGIWLAEMKRSWPRRALDNLSLWNRKKATLLRELRRLEKTLEKS